MLKHFLAIWCCCTVCVDEPGGAGGAAYLQLQHHLHLIVTQWTDVVQDQSCDDDKDVNRSPADDKDGNHHQDHAGDPTQVPVLLL